MAVLAYVPKLKRCLGLAFSEHFLHFHIVTKFQCHTFFLSQNIKQNVLLSFYLNN